jgi:hypothetical protein
MNLNATLMLNLLILPLMLQLNQIYNINLILFNMHKDKEE